MIYCFDLDGTLCTQTKNGQYLSAIPFKDAILEVNKLFENGHKIIIDTARGSSSGIDWYQDTKSQLDSWGLKYTELRVGKKINADIFIDDKSINASAWRLLIDHKGET
jgi:hypothetical protein